MNAEDSPSNPKYSSVDSFVLLQFRSRLAGIEHGARGGYHSA